MWAILGVILVTIIIICIEAPSLLRRKSRRELILFSAFLAIGMISGVMEAMKMNLPNPHQWAEVIFKPAGEWIVHIFS